MAEADPHKTSETWEAQTKSTVFVYRHDKRTGQYVSTRVGGPNGAQRITLMTADREYHQAMIPEENRHLDPFVNGRLRRVDPGAADGGSQAPANTELLEMLEVREEDDFKTLAENISDELTVRRLYTAAEATGTVRQVEIVRDIIDERYRVSKGQKVVEEMMNVPDGMLAGSDFVVSS